MESGYAIDDSAGVIFVNEKVSGIISLNDKNNAYYISIIGGRVNDQLLTVTEILK